MKTSLVILAAGIGSRYGGGVKQLEAMGPNGELIIDYSIHDALEAGFDKVVFIIRPDIEEDFKEVIGHRTEALTEVEYVCQTLEDLPAGYQVPKGRHKPWGTSQALLCARDAVKEPFAVINADDYYGKSAYRTLHDYLISHDSPSDGFQTIAMVAFVLGRTLSDNGGVTRGICHLDDSLCLTGISETKNIIRTGGGAGVMTEDGLKLIDDKSPVSMNFWGFYPDFFETLKKGFPLFLDGLDGESALTAEYLLPVTVDGLIRNGSAKVAVLRSEDSWFGVTYKEDKPSVKASFDELIRQGVYQTPLF